MKLPIYFLDAFTTQVFKGNPAAVCPLDNWLPNETLQAIAAENNLAETAFFVSINGGFHLRWFTPTVEVELCGHATLACAWVLFNKLGFQSDTIKFQTLSGDLSVSKTGQQLTLDFPGRDVTACVATPELLENFKTKPREILKSGSGTYIVVFDSEAAVKNYLPDMIKLARVDRAINITARGNSCDFVSRFFGPNIGLPEDPVTGSAHCGLAIYWSRQLGKTKNLHAIQLSHRTGEIFCTLQGDRVLLTGSVVPYLTGHIEI